MTRYMHENSDKRHRCPACHCVMPYRYRPIRKWFCDITIPVPQRLFSLRRRLSGAYGPAAYYPFARIDRWLPRRCGECGDVVAVPAWIAHWFELEN